MRCHLIVNEQKCDNKSDLLRDAHQICLKASIKKWTWFVLALYLLWKMVSLVPVSSITCIFVSVQFMSFFNSQPYDVGVNKLTKYQPNNLQRESEEYHTMVSSQAVFREG